MKTCNPNHEVDAETVARRQISPSERTSNGNARRGERVRSTTSEVRGHTRGSAKGLLHVRLTVEWTPTQATAVHVERKHLKQSGAYANDAVRDRHLQLRTNTRDELGQLLDRRVTISPSEVVSVID